MIIVGAGMAGLLAGALDRRATVFEAQSTLPNNHHAVLRFREDKIARALDIPFRKVHVLKEVAGSRSPIQDANAYALKVSGQISARSILNMEPVDRFIAPPNFIEQMAELVGDRLHLGRNLEACDLEAYRVRKEPVLSTAPMNAMLRMLGVPHEPREFQYSGVRVWKYRVHRCDTYQTIYYPYDTIFYRATLTGDELILESAVGDDLRGDDWITESLETVLQSFNITTSIDVIGSERQTLGKIVPLPDARRKALILAMTIEHGVFSLGRYALWSNLILDQVYEDYLKVKRLMALDNAYDFRGHVS